MMPRECITQKLYLNDIEVGKHLMKLPSEQFILRLPFLDLAPAENNNKDLFLQHLYTLYLYSKKCNKSRTRVLYGHGPTFCIHTVLYIQ